MNLFINYTVRPVSLEAEYMDVRLSDVTVIRRSTAAPTVNDLLLATTKCSEDRIPLSNDITARCINSSWTCAELSCNKLLSKPVILDNTTADYITWRNSASITDSHLVQLTSDCAEFRRSRGFDRNTSISNQVVDVFPLAFNILTHRDADQLARLLRALYRPHNVYCIHVDAHSSPVFQSAVHHLAACFDNVQVASKLESIVYAGFSRLQADITCMKDNVNSSFHWRYLINTAAQAFPLKTVEEMVKVGIT